jgi:hypothetical protein
LKPFLRQNLLVIKDLLQVQSHLVVVFPGDLVSIRQILVQVCMDSWVLNPAW